MTINKNPNDMTEAELAEFYFEHRDDPRMWGEQVPSREPERLDAIISLRFTKDEATSVREAAKAAGISVSDLLRAAALKAVRAGNVVDLDRVRRDVARVQELAADAMRALA